MTGADNSIKFKGVKKCLLSAYNNAYMTYFMLYNALNGYILDDPLQGETSNQVLLEVGQLSIDMNVYFLNTMHFAFKTLGMEILKLFLLLFA